jgi:hypothetical protein
MTLIPSLPRQPAPFMDLETLTDFVDCARFYAQRRDWSQHRVALSDAVTALEDEVFVLFAARYEEGE